MTQAESPRTKGGTRQTMTCILVLVAGMERQAVVNWRQGTRKEKLGRSDQSDDDKRGTR